MASADDIVEQIIEDSGAGESMTPVLPSEAHFTQIPYRSIIATCAMMGTMMQTLDATIANVALPDMQGTLSGTQDEMGWVLTSYIVAAAITIPLSGWLASALGRRKVYLISIALFTIASAFAGIATSLPQIVLFRFLQGMGGAALTPLSQAVLFDINSPKDFGRAMAIWGAGVSVGPIMGPTLGGWLTQEFSWRWVFFINLPVGVVAFAGLYLTLPESRNANAPRFDFFGFTVLSIAVAAFQLMLDRGQLNDWFSSREIIAEAIVAAIGAYLFIVHMFSSRDPFLNPALFKDRNFMMGNIFIFLIGVLLFATLALLPPLLQNGMRYPEFLTGLVLAPRGIGTIIAMFVAGRLVDRVDQRLVMATGLAATTFALWEMSHYSLQMGTWSIVMPGFVQGLGTGMVYMPLSAIAFTTLPRQLRNEGTSFFSLVRNIGSSIGISVVLFLLVENTQRLHSALASHVTRYGAANPAALAQHFDLGSLPSLAALDAEITRQSALIATIDDFKLMMVLCILTIPALILIKPPARQSDTIVVVE